MELIKSVRKESLSPIDFDFKDGSNLLSKKIEYRSYSQGSVQIIYLTENEIREIHDQYLSILDKYDGKGQVPIFLTAFAFNFEKQEINEKYPFAYKRFFPEVIKYF